MAAHSLPRRIRVRRFDRYAHLRSDHTVDLALFTIDHKPAHRLLPGRPPKELQVLLLRRRGRTFGGWWALPGGYLHPRETLEQAAYRELGEEIGMTGVYLEQLKTYDAIDRDPRRRTIATAYIGLVPPDKKEHARAGSSAYDARWFPVDDLPPHPDPRDPRRLAFDHDQILADAIARLRNKVDYTLLAFQLLPPEFTLSELRQVYEAILDEDLGSFDEGRKANFNRAIRALNAKFGVLVPTGRKKKGARGPAADLYQFVGQPNLITR